MVLMGQVCQHLGDVVDQGGTLRDAIVFIGSMALETPHFCVGEILQLKGIIKG
jgi:hypothetical protein